MKKIIVIILALVLVVGLVACGGKGKDSNLIGVQCPLRTCSAGFRMATT